MFKFYRQLEHSDCGLTCVRMIARCYGMKIPAKTLRGFCETGRLGISIADIIDTLKAINIRGVAIKVSPDKLDEMPLPAIMFWDQNHFVVCYGIDTKKRRYLIADPALGKVSLPEEEFLKHWCGNNSKGICIVTEPEDNFNPKQFGKVKEPFKLKKLFKEATLKYRSKFTIILIFTIISLITDMFVPFLFQRTVDDGINGKDIHLVWLLILGQLFVFIGNYISSNIVDILLTKLGLKMSIEMMNEYLRKLISLPMSFFDTKVNSDLLQKTNDQERIKSFLLNSPTEFFLTSLTLVIFSILLIYFDYLIFVIFVALSLLSIGWNILFLRKRRHIDYSYFTYASDNRNALYELVYGMQEIKSNNAQESRVEKWNDTQEKINRLSIKSAMLNILIGSGTTFFIRMRDIAITGICATMVIEDSMTIGVMMTVNYIVGRLSNPFNTITNSITDVQDASLSYERISEILESPEPKMPADKAQKAEISFNGVWFKYPGSRSPFVIKNADVLIPEGKITALVGNSGSGKSTLIKLMLGFYSPQKGKLQLGGRDISEIDINDWLGRCGVVMQSGYIFSDTVLKNIGLSDIEPDEERVKEAARLACLDEFISKMPMGYHTILGEKGLEMSGGQKQRLLIARAIYKNPQILFLDEATSSLDANNERRIIENLREFRKGKTVVIAAHRLSTVKDAHNIIYIENGEVTEQGTHEELIELKGKYYNLVKNQLALAE